MRCKRSLELVLVQKEILESDSEDEGTWSYIPGSFATIFKNSLSKSSSPTQSTTVPTPWITNVSEFNGTRCEFVNILTKEICTLDLPDFQNAKLLHSRDGWLLIYQRDGSIFLINVFTFARINLPKVDRPPNCAVFSTFSTTPSCVILAYISYSELMVKVARPGDDMWVQSEYGRKRLTPIGSIAAILLSGCLLRLFSKPGKMVVFDLSNMNWRVHRTLLDNRGFGYFMLDCEGKVLKVVRSISDSLSTSFSVYRLDSSETAWVEAGDVENWSFFVGNPTVGGSIAVKDKGMKVYEMRNLTVKSNCIKGYKYRPRIKVHGLVDGSTQKIYLPKEFNREHGMRWVEVGY